MKKEIISFVIGGGIVGSIWCCKTFCESKPEAASVAVAPEPQKNDVKNQQSSICPSETAIHDDEAYLQDWISAISDSDGYAQSATANWWREYKYDVKYVGNGLVSFYCQENKYEGTTHGQYKTIVGTIYRGKRLQLKELPEFDKIHKTFRRALESHKDFEAVKLYIDSPLHNLKYVVDKEVQMTENFYIDEKGIHFIYDPYEIASFAAGTIDIFVPYKIKFNAK